MDQHLIGGDEDDELLQRDCNDASPAPNSPQQDCDGDSPPIQPAQPSTSMPDCAQRNYKDFIEHLIKQLSTAKRKHAELQYEELEKGGGSVINLLLILELVRLSQRSTAISQTE